MAAVIAALMLACGAGPARAYRAESLPAQLQQVGLTEHIGLRLPDSLTFQETQGKDAQGKVRP